MDARYPNGKSDKARAEWFNLFFQTAMSSRKVRALPVYPPEMRDSILKAIAEAPGPVPVKDLGTLSELGRKVPGTHVQGLLADDLNSGKVFQWGDSNKPAFWSRNPKIEARQRILKIAAERVLTPGRLSAEAVGGKPKLNLNVVRAVQKELIGSGLLREVPAAPRSTTERLINADHPEILEPEIARLTEALFAKYGVIRSPERIRALLAADATQPTHEPALARADDEEIIRDAAEKIFAAMNRVAFAPGTTVTFYRLRQQGELADIPKPIFDRAALLLQKERRALLSIHDHAAALSPEEREGFVTDGLGKYYVSIYAR